MEGNVLKVRASTLGAGWGGFTVSLLPPEVDCGDFQKKLEREYYNKHANLFKAGMPKMIEVRPAPGASVLKVQDILG